MKHLKKIVLLNENNSELKPELTKIDFEEIMYDLTDEYQDYNIKIEYIEDSEFFTYFLSIHLNKVDDVHFDFDIILDLSIDVDFDEIFDPQEDVYLIRNKLDKFSDKLNRFKNTVLMYEKIDDIYKRLNKILPRFKDYDLIHFESDISLSDGNYYFDIFMY